MELITFILAASLCQVTLSNILRLIRARAGDVLLSVVCNYGVAVLVAAGYWVASGPSGPGVVPAVAVGLPGGVFYALALVAIVRSMGQRGLALTMAFAGMGQLVPSLVAVGLGDALGWLSGVGLVLATATLPLLSLATARGKAISEPPNLRLAGALVALQGGAMTANLLASRMVPAAHFPTYLVALFASALVVSLVWWLTVRGAATAADARRGALFGALNMLAAFVMVTAASRLSGALFFAGMSVTSLLLSTLLAVWLWRERLQKRGWLGLALAAAALALMNL